MRWIPAERSSTSSLARARSWPYCTMKHQRDTKWTCHARHCRSSTQPPTSLSWFTICCSRRFAIGERLIVAFSETAILVHGPRFARSIATVSYLRPTDNCEKICKQMQTVNVYIKLWLMFYVYYFIFILHRMSMVAIRRNARVTECINIRRVRPYWHWAFLLFRKVQGFLRLFDCWGFPDNRFSLINWFSSPHRSSRGAECAELGIPSITGPWRHGGIQSWQNSYVTTWMNHHHARD